MWLRRSATGWPGLDKAEAGYEHHLLEALWVYQHHDVVREDLLRQLLGAQEFRARAAAVRVLQHWSDRVADATALMERAANDPSPRVRLEAVRSLSFIATPEATDAALDVLKHTTDYYIQYALDSTITTLEKAWKPALTAGRAISADHPEGLAYLLARLISGRADGAAAQRAGVSRAAQPARCGAPAIAPRRWRGWRESAGGRS